MTARRLPDPAVVAAVGRWGASALAWEVLRRNREYRSAFELMSPQPAGRAADRAFTRRWGLHFR
jgi:DUF917 family protein